MSRQEVRLLWIVAGVCLLLYALNWAAAFLPATKASALGDMFGAVNALFSGAAFFGVIVAILLQKEELGLQRKELEQTRVELKGQKEQLQLQNETFQKQGFETTFFQMLSLQHQIVAAIDIRTGDGRVYRLGRDCFGTFYE